MPAFPPVAIRLVQATSALQPRAELVALLACFLRLGIIAVAALALRIRRQPSLDERRRSMGRGSKDEDEAGRGQRQCDRGSDRQTRPASWVKAHGDDRKVGRRHETRHTGSARGLQPLRRLFETPALTLDSFLHGLQKDRRATPVATQRTEAPMTIPDQGEREAIPQAVRFAARHVAVSSRRNVAPAEFMRVIGGEEASDDAQYAVATLSRSGGNRRSRRVRNDKLRPSVQDRIPDLACLSSQQSLS